MFNLTKQEVKTLSNILKCRPTTQEEMEQIAEEAIQINN